MRVKIKRKEEQERLIALNNSGEQKLSFDGMEKYYEKIGEIKKAENEFIMVKFNLFNKYNNSWWWTVNQVEVIPECFVSNKMKYKLFYSSSDNIIKNCEAAGIIEDWMYGIEEGNLVKMIKNYVNVRRTLENE